MINKPTIDINEPSSINILLGLQLDEALKLLKGYDVQIFETSANTVLNKKINPNDYCVARVVNLQLNGEHIVLTYSFFKADVK